MDKKGNIYGTTYAGGAYGYGTIFELTTAGVEKVLLCQLSRATGRRESGGTCAAGHEGKFVWHDLRLAESLEWARCLSWSAAGKEEGAVQLYGRHGWGVSV